MLKGVARQRLLEFVSVIFPCYMAMQVALSRRVRQSTAWYCVARRGVTDATWSGLASEIWFDVHCRAIIVGCVGEGGNLRLSGALDFIYT